MRNIILFFLCLVLYACQENSSTAIHQLFEDIQSFEQRNDPFFQFSSGNHPDSIASISWSRQEKNLEAWNQFSQRMASIPSAELNHQDQISQTTMQLKLQNLISGIQYKTNLIPFNAEGGFYNEIQYYLHSLPFKNKDDYEKYLSWLPDYVRFLKEGQSLMKQGMKEKIISSKIVASNNIQMLEPLCDNDLKNNIFYQPFQSIPENINNDDANRLRLEGKRILIETVLPAYQDLLSFFKEEYLPVAYKEPGIDQIPNGREYYRDRVSYYTTLEISPDSVFALGQQEVKRIRDQMEGIIDELNFDGNYAEFLDFLRTDPQFYAKSGDELLQYAAWLSKKAEGQLPKLFNQLYELPFTVEPVPDAIAPSYTAGRYVHGSFEQEKPGIYWVNTYNLPARTLYTYPALTLHEAVPGHHLQTMIAAELEGIPEFRKQYYISAFGEGWGLYAEFLGEEMGMYEDPYDLFGRYTYEMWRACRLVVDVGLHYKGWSRQQALEFLGSNTALSKHEVRTEIDRYIGWPGQALSYKIGEITIKNLRILAEEELGGDFDIKEFHQVILKNGSVPLPILKEEVKDYIDSKK